MVSFCLFCATNLRNRLHLVSFNKMGLGVPSCAVVHQSVELIFVILLGILMLEINFFSFPQHTRAHFYHRPLSRTLYHTVQFVFTDHVVHTILKWNFTLKKHCSECVWGKSSWLSGFPFSILCLLEVAGVLYVYIYGKAKWLALRSDEFIAMCFSPTFKLHIISFCWEIREWRCGGADQQYVRETN